MFIAMNRFRIAPGSETAFEEVWRRRDSRLEEVDGFLAFQLLRGPSTEAETLYVSHSTWRDRAAFDAWRRSPPFRASHAAAGDSRAMYLGPPQFEGFEPVAGA